jgi:DNA-binding response OmpR family regulator
MKILLVEDDAPLAMGIEYALNKEGFEVVCARSIKEAHELFGDAVNSTGKEFDLILLDVALPDGNGYDFCKDIRKKSEVSIIFMTALDDEANVVFGLDIGGDDYIAKPVRISELISRINALMRRQKRNKANEPDKKIVSGNLTIEPLKCRVCVDGEEIYLTAVEYKLLLVLVENKGNVINRGTIVEKLWDIDGNFVDYNTLNVYMKRLREKIETEADKHIETIRGIGYMWKDEVDRT